MNYKDRIIKWWEECRVDVWDTIRNCSKGKNIVVPLLIDGVLDRAEYDAAKDTVSVYAYVNTSKEATPMGWSDGTVYTDETKWVLILEESS